MSVRVPTGRSRATIADVARAAGVSKGVASMALNGKGRMTPATRERVRKVARDLKYVPDIRAQRLVGGRSYAIATVSSMPAAVLANESQYTVILQLATSLAPLLLDKGYSLVVAPPISEPRYFDRIDVDGVIMTDPIDDDPILERFIDRGVAVVTIGKVKTSEPVSYLDRGYAGADVAVEHLRSKGARRIGFILSEEPFVSTIAAARYAKEHGRDDDLEIHIATASIAGGGGAAGEAYEHLQNLAGRLDAIYAPIDLLAAEATSKIISLGLEIPGDVMVMTNANSTRSRNTKPPLTSLTVDNQEQAQRVAELMFEQLDSDSSTTSHSSFLPLSVIERQSTAR
ncbi:LacI family DNA-binding transcriptional regulator [Microbacterium sp. 18062]|uniref:LacI family DNA-binding transcriptional regulator n=1 Tax=Microbacterium sp. 18062 TaxID=2681410 RepID=UPI001357B40A|nr:LacI family DNA-binding transcriptional regulator [Microbacterium sp. 18062]